MNSAVNENKLPSYTDNMKDNIHKVILEDALAGYWDWDIPNNYEYLSPTFKSMLGFEEHELPHSPEAWQDLIFQEDLPPVMENFNDHVQSRGKVPYQNIVRYKHKTGSTVWVNCTGRVIEWMPDGSPKRMVGCHIDVTDRIIYENNLKISEQQFKGSFKYSAIGMALVSLEGKWIEVNDKLCQYLNYTTEELKAKTFQEITHPDDLETDLEYLNEILEGKRETYQMEKRYFKKNGEIIWIVLSVSLVKDFDGNPVHFVSQIEDITNRKKAEKELQEYLSIIQSQNKRLLNFAHIVSHNLRSHSGNLEMMLRIIEQETDENEIKEMMGHLNSISKSLSDTILNLNDVITIQTQKGIEIEEINIEKYINSAIDVLKADIIKTKAGVRIDTSKVNTVKFSPAYFESVVINLLSNSIKYKHPDRAPEVQITTRMEDDRVVLEFSDNGLGINLEKHKNNIFGMYKTFHEHENANGLGLFMVKNQVESLGGKISVESIVNMGTKFIIQF